jgi:proline racemase
MSFPTVRTIDYHTGGEPFRLVPDPPVRIDGDSIADRRITAMNSTEVDTLRKVLCFEPRGHADMYGGFITPADDDGADFGVLFWHKDGFSTACGHGTIALGVWAVESGRVRVASDGPTDVTIDVPSGRVIARVHVTQGVADVVDFISVPSYVMATDIAVETSRGSVHVDIGFGGAIYAHVRAADVGLAVTPANAHELISVGREIKWALNNTVHARHPSDSRLSGIYGTILYDELGHHPTGDVHQRNVAIFADGELDRSPCGSGTASRMAVLHARGQLAVGETLVNDSIVGSRFAATIIECVRTDGFDAVIPQITGTAYKTGEHVFQVAARDPLFPGFVLR